MRQGQGKRTIGRALAAGLVVGLIVGACGSPTSSATSSSGAAASAGTAASAGAGASAGPAASAGAGPVTLNILDVAGNLQLTKGMIENFKAAHPEIVSSVTYSTAAAPEMAGKLQAQQQGGQVQTSLVLTGPDGCLLYTSDAAAE